MNSTVNYCVWYLWLFCTINLFIWFRCEANVTVAKTLSNTTLPCKLESRPSLVAIVMHILAFFGAGITMSSWVWNASTVDSWRRFVRRWHHALFIFSLFLNTTVYFPSLAWSTKLWNKISHWYVPISCKNDGPCVDHRRIIKEGLVIATTLMLLVHLHLANAKVTSFSHSLLQNSMCYSNWVAVKMKTTFLFRVPCLLL